MSEPSILAACFFREGDSLEGPIRTFLRLIGLRFTRGLKEAFVLRFVVWFVRFAAWHNFVLRLDCNGVSALYVKNVLPGRDFLDFHCIVGGWA
jgi:hypothetical protein